MDHQKQIRDSLEKHNQLVFKKLSRSSPVPIPNIPFARSAKNTIKITMSILVQINIENASASAAITSTSKIYATSTNSSGKAVRKKLTKKPNRELWKRKKEETELLRFNLNINNSRAYLIANEDHNL